LAFFARLFPDAKRAKDGVEQSFRWCCRSRIVTDETRDGIVVASRHQNKITLVKNKQHAQIPANATFIESAERPDTNAGVKVWSSK